MHSVPWEDSDVGEETLDRKRMIIAGPSGDLTDDNIRPCDALVDEDGFQGLRTFSMKIKLDPGDIEKLADNGGFFMLTVVANQLVPFAVDTLY